MSENLPKAYKRGLQDFYGRDFMVNSDVLIPRPETEMIIDTVLNLVGKPYLPGVKPSEAKLPKNITILDVGTGSGCIAITLKLEIPEATVIATDISEQALKIAEKNKEKFGADIRLIKSDLMKGIDIKPDLVIANLPYVDKDWDWVDKSLLSYEPELALYANNHGLELILKIIDEANERTIPYLVLEADPCQHEEIIAYAEKRGYHLGETRGFALRFDR